MNYVEIFRDQIGRPNQPMTKNLRYNLKFGRKADIIMLYNYKCLYREDAPSCVLIRTDTIFKYCMEQNMLHVF